MCGIAGMVSLTARPLKEPRAVRRMMERLAHRGPDEEGFFLNPAGTAALGHRRLRIIDLRTGQQPMANEAGTIWLSFNGEIYGFQALRNQLEAEGARFRTTSDTEVILHLYERYGVDCVHQLKGMFALAIWDEPARRLLLVRDRLGKKPLYYALADGAILFASELDPLMSATALSREPDRWALDQYLTLGYIPAPRTIYRHVQKLEAGQYLVVSDGEPTLTRFWRPEATNGNAVPESFEEMKRELTDRLRASTALRMVSDVPIGCFLSGGVDSSTVLSFMAELSSRPVKTFSIGFPEAEFSELPYARAVARHFNTEHHEFVVQPDGIEILDRLVAHFGEPFGDSSALPTWYLSELTRKSVTVALSGDGGDELFAGYGWYKTAQMLERLSSIPASVARGGAMLADLQRPRLLGRLGRAFAMLAERPASRHARLRQLVSASVKDRLYTDGYRAEMGEQALDWLAGRHDSLAVRDPLNRMMATDLATYMADDLLVKVDRMTMAHALECRSPLLDTDLVEWVLTLPSSVKLPRTIRHGGVQDGKFLLREAVRDRFPPRFLDRPKRGFSVPLERWFQRGLRSIVTDRVLHGSLDGLGLFRPAGMQQLVEEHFDGRANHASLIWSLLVLATWSARSGAA
jgi:asparagine synthase (glutamine-hydrolysing)